MDVNWQSGPLSLSLIRLWPLGSLRPRSLSPLSVRWFRWDQLIERAGEEAAVSVRKATNLTLGSINAEKNPSKSRGTTVYGSEWLHHLIMYRIANTSAQWSLFFSFFWFSFHTNPNIVCTHLTILKCNTHSLSPFPPLVRSHSYTGSILYTCSSRTSY